MLLGLANVGQDAAVAEPLARYVEEPSCSTGGAQPHTRIRGTAAATANISGVTVLLDGQPWWNDGSGPATARAIANAYLSRGSKLLVELNGAFAIAVYDEPSASLTLAIDRMGISSVAWAVDGPFIVFSTSAAAVANRPGARYAVRHQALYDYFFFHMVPSPETAFEGVSKLAAASHIVFSEFGRHESNYWTPDFHRSGASNFETLRADLHSTLESAVRRQYAGRTTGAFLSGGLDSSTVTGYLARVAQPATCNTFSIGFGQAGYDELEYARIANRHFGCTAHEYVVSADDVLAAIPIVASAFDEPFGNSSAIPTYACAKFARSSGTTRLLAGDGGDELFAGNDRYGRQKVFELYNRVPRALREASQRFVQRRIDVESRVALLRKVRSYVDQASTPLPERYETWNLVYREGSHLLFDDEFLASVDLERPLRHMREVFQSTPSKDLIDRMLYYDWKFTLADSDLRKVTVACAAAGMGVEFPMLDNGVVELSARVPSSLKMKGRQLRTFYKRAMRGFLPEQVLTKTKHGFGLPFGHWLKSSTALAEAIYGSLSDLKRRGIVKAEFIDSLIDQHRTGHHAYYGFLIWDLAILEEWLKVRATSASTRLS